MRTDAPASFRPKYLGGVPQGRGQSPLSRATGAKA